MTAARARIAQRLRVLLGLPRRLYAHGLGWLLGARFLQLNHTGRASGHRYATVLEVLHHNRATGELVVMSGLGRDADWYRNVHASGPTSVTIGRTQFRARIRDLEPEEAVAVLGADERRNRLLAPLVHVVLSRLVGWPYRGTPIQRWRLARDLPLVGLRPQ
jgi:deazaflavin-dependent oxidoreductase (nitroreductase family)